MTLIGKLEITVHHRPHSPWRRKLRTVNDSRRLATPETPTEEADES